jgi:hypothetical protein
MSNVQGGIFGASRNAPLARPDRLPAPIEGWLVNLSGESVVMQGDRGDELIQAVSEDVRITFNGEECDPRDLDPGTRIRVTIPAMNQAVVWIDGIGRPRQLANLS